TICCLFVKKIPLVIPEELDEKLCAKKTLIYTILFALAIIIIFRVIPYGYGLLIIPFSLLILDNKALKDIDYFLLLTFCAFFVFSGNVSRIPSVSFFLKGIMAENTLLTGVVSSQFISNVPAAILLSRFTTDYQALLVSVNIGGVGTLIASLASLITYGEYVKHNPSKQWHFIKIFSIYNFGFLMILTMICLMW
ncbi:MAG: citrate transporter, partial [Eubacteriaceae bacterium]